MPNAKTGLALLLLVSGFISAETFPKSKLVNAGREVPVKLTLDKDSGTMTLSNASMATISIPYARVEKLSYEQAARHRVKEGAIVMLASFGAGGVVMLTKSKSHWLHVDYKDSDGNIKNLVLKLDKRECKPVLSVLHEQTGKEVQTLASTKGNAYR